MDNPELLFHLARHASFFAEATLNPGGFNKWLPTLPPKFQRILHRMNENLEILLNDNHIRIYRTLVLPNLLQGDIGFLMKFMLAAPRFGQYLCHLWEDLHPIIIAWEEGNHELVNRHRKFHGFIKDCAQTHLIEQLIEKKDIVCLRMLCETADGSDEEFFLVGLEACFRLGASSYATIILQKFPHLAINTQAELDKSLKEEIDDKKTVAEVIETFNQCRQKISTTNAFFKTLYAYLPNPGMLSLHLQKYCYNRAITLMQTLTPDERLIAEQKIKIFQWINDKKPETPYITTVEVGPTSEDPYSFLR